MGVPAEIRAVPRPTNTIVVDTGSKGPKRLDVRERAGEKYIPGGNPQPRSGKTIGYIINYKFYAKENKTLADKPQYLSFGSSELIRQTSQDIVDELLTVYDPNDARDIIAIASLKTLRPKIKARKMRTHYESTFLSVFFPGASLSEGRITELYKRIGMDALKREAFYELRAKSIKENEHIIIDGTLKQDTSRENFLSQPSRKSRVRGVKDISILYTYSLERMEPICCQVYPGNEPDISAFRSFVLANHITKGILVGDKAFPPSQIKDVLDANEELHFITPLKSNDTRIKANDIYNWQGQLSTTQNYVLYAKKQIRGGRFLYAYKDTGIESKQKRNYLANERKAAKKRLDSKKASSKDDSDKQAYEDDAYAIDLNELKKQEEKFGVVVLESDLDLNHEIVYKIYQDRWKIEFLFKRYKNDIELNKTHVEIDDSVHGAEFVNFISTILMSRIIQRMAAADLLDEHYSDIIEGLGYSFRKADAPSPAKRDDGKWLTGLVYNFDLMEKMGVVEKKVIEPKKRGRKPKKETESSNK